jgi:hypothetical protein
MGTFRREVLDHFLIINKQHLKRVIKEFVEY